MTEALKLCPFCGNPPQTKEWHQKGLPTMRIFCDECNMNLQIQGVKDWVIERWNYRPLDESVDAEYINMKALLKASTEALAIVSKRNIDAAILLVRLSGRELGVHHIGDKEPYYTSWDDGEYWLKQALEILSNSNLPTDE